VDKPSFDENDAKALTDISKQVAWLDLNGKKIGVGAIRGTWKAS
jgi:hypothetical protein